MQTLIERIEAAQGPDRGLDAEIALASGDYITRAGRDGMFAHKDRPNEYSMFCPAYTASLDAAITLVPEGFMWNVGGSGGSAGGARVWDSEFAPDVNVAATPALALCLAALKARNTDNA